MSENKPPHSWGFLFVKKMMGIGGQQEGVGRHKKADRHSVIGFRLLI